MPSAFRGFGLLFLLALLSLPGLALPAPVKAGDFAFLLPEGWEQDTSTSVEDMGGWLFAYGETCAVVFSSETTDYSGASERQQLLEAFKKAFREDHSASFKADKYEFAGQLWDRLFYNDEDNDSFYALFVYNESRIWPIYILLRGPNKPFPQAATDLLKTVRWPGMPEQAGDQPGSGQSASAALVKDKLFKLTKGSDGFLLAASYPTSDLALQLAVNYSKPGILLDSVGINVAPVGSLSLGIGADGAVSLNLFAPSAQSQVRDASGWHRLVSSVKVPANARHIIRIELLQGSLSLSLDGAKQAEATLNVPLSGAELWIGDFPGDNSWGSNYNIHPALGGNVFVEYLGQASGATTGSAGGSSTGGGTSAGSGPGSASGVEFPEHIEAVSASGVNAAASKLQQALASGNAEAASLLILPEIRADLLLLFQQQPDSRKVLAQLLATRKLTTATSAAAEYEVTDEGQVFYIKFYLVESQWLLAGL